MRARPDGLAAGELSRALAAGWQIDAAAARYAAVGGGSYHWVMRDRAGRRWFVTADDLDDKAWLGDTRPAVMAVLEQLLTILWTFFRIAPCERRRAPAVQAGEPGRRFAAGQLRQAILSGDMAPGQRLVEEELAGLLAVTRASLRAALFDLTAEGLVERIPNRGARVRAVTLDEAVAITECRMALEGLCAAKAAELVTEPQAVRLRQLGEEMERSVADGEPLKYSALNHELHRLIREISAQVVAADMLERLNGQLVRHQFQLSMRPGRPQASLPEHLAMISAITGRQPAEAEEATRRHLRSVITALRETEEAP